tara:strand:+ start:416 stop:3349 length:2934 start_codon:yes stop_codon:yes gene_type:complete
VIYNGLTIDRQYTEEGTDVYDFPTQSTVSEIKDPNTGRIVFKQEGLEFPEKWSQTAINITASKYLKDGLSQEHGYKEHSIEQLVRRVANTITQEGVTRGYFDEEQGQAFHDELAHMLIHQHASFNSPVWFNVGLSEAYGLSADADEKYHHAWDHEKQETTSKIDIYQRPQISACFISSIDDNMESILELVKREGMLYKWGSGNGVNYSTLRGFREPLSQGGHASGMMYFYILGDYVGKIIKSGGKTRRAAKMARLDDDHPDIYRFVRFKGNEEIKARALQAYMRYAPEHAFDLDDEAHFTVAGQNANNSIGISDRFMHAYLNGEEWELRHVTADRQETPETEVNLDDYIDDRYFPDKEFLTRITTRRKFTDARTLMEVITEEASKSGDPGLQFDDTINEWHTCLNSGRINSSNPCSEYMFLDDSACNLASLNLTKFIKEDGTFDTEKFQHASKLMIIAQEILVDYASYPGRDMAQNSHDFRALGLGYGNLGALLMEQGIPYDSEEGRAIASSITSLMTATAYNQSAEIAKIKGPFSRFEENREPFMKVMQKHKDANDKIPVYQSQLDLESILESTREGWDRVLAQEYFRNAQVTLIAPTGTISRMMDFDTTGIEPELGLVTTKNLSGGGSLKLENRSVIPALRRLDYGDQQIEQITQYIRENETIFGAPELQDEHLPVFATSLDPQNMIDTMGHVSMMGAIQRFLSGAISKTVNAPEGTTKEQVEEIYLESWKQGLKSIAVYVYGCKGDVQPIQVGTRTEDEELKWSERKRLDPMIDSYKVRVRVNGTPVHLHFGEDSETGLPLEIFSSFGGAGSPYANVYGSLSKSISRSIQYGQPLEKIVKDHIGAIGAINGLTDHPYIKSCTSVEDLMARIIAGEYLEDTSSWQVQPTNPEKLRINILKRRKRFERADKLIHPEFYEDDTNEIDQPTGSTQETQNDIKKIESNDIKICTNCGNVMEQSGTCFTCTKCGETSGCS